MPMLYMCRLQHGSHAHALHVQVAGDEDEVRQVERAVVGDQAATPERTGLQIPREVVIRQGYKYLER